MRGWILRLVAFAMMIVAVADTSIASEPGFKIVVHPSNPIDSIEREFLRDAFLKKRKDWRDGKTIRPIDLGSGAPAREKFGEQILRKTPAQLKTYWSQQIFSGKAVPPPEAASTADVVAYVLANPGAVGYVPLDAAVGKAKVLRTR